MTHDELRSAIRSVGLRATLQHIAVLGVMARAERPLTHGELCKQLVVGANDRATVYRNVMDLARTGLVRRVALGGRTWQFELVRGAPHARAHPHFACTSCGRVTCLPEGIVDVSGVRGPRALRRGEYDVHLRGICDECRGARA